MNQPKLKAIVFFLGTLGVGFAIGVLLLPTLRIPYTLYNFINVTAFAFLFAVVLTVWLDRPLDLELFKWPEEKPEPEVRPEASATPTQPAAEEQAPVRAEVEAEAVPVARPSEIPTEAMFPHESPTEHWDIDFGDSKQAYQGSDLPVWILAGWAVFILWALIYLIVGLPTAF
jgi:hypothetical protein